MNIVDLSFAQLDMKSGLGWFAQAAEEGVEKGLTAAFSLPDEEPDTVPEFSQNSADHEGLVTETEPLNQHVSEKADKPINPMVNDWIDEVTLPLKPQIVISKAAEELEVKKIEVKEGATGLPSSINHIPRKVLLPFQSSDFLKKTTSTKSELIEKSDRSHQVAKIIASSPQRVSSLAESEELLKQHLSKIADFFSPEKVSHGLQKSEDNRIELKIPKNAKYSDFDAKNLPKLGELATTTKNIDRAISLSELAYVAVSANASPKTELSINTEVSVQPITSTGQVRSDGEKPVFQSPPGQSMVPADGAAVLGASTFASNGVSMSPVGVLGTPEAPFSKPLDLAENTNWISRLGVEILALSGSKSRMSFQLFPAHLGKMNVQIFDDGEGDRIKLETENEISKAIIVLGQKRLEEDVRQASGRSLTVDVAVREEVSGQLSSELEDQSSANYQPAIREIGDKELRDLLFSTSTSRLVSPASKRSVRYA